MGKDYSSRGPRRFNSGNRGYGHQSHHQPVHVGAPPAVADEILATETLVTERKILTLSRRQNRSGQFLRIDESHHGRRSCVIIPAENIDDVLDAMEKLFPEEPETA